MQLNDTPVRRLGSRLGPVLLSALVYPGLGQLVQRRWLAAVCHAAAFTAASVWFAVNAARVLIAYYGFMYDAAGGASPPVVSISQILVPFGVAMLCYLVNLADVVIRGRGR